MLSVEKVYDELYGMIEDLKKKVAALSGCDEVTITPALESGTKIADYAIGDVPGVLYAPMPADPAWDFDSDVKIGTLGTDDVYLAKIETTFSTNTTIVSDRIFRGTIATPADLNIANILHGFGYYTVSGGYRSVLFINAAVSASEIDVYVNASRTDETLDLWIIYTKTQP